MSKYKRLFANTIWFGISNVSSRAALFLLLPVYTSYMTDAEFGIYELTTTAIFFLIPLFTLQITNALVRFGLDSGEDIEEIFSCATIFVVAGLLLSILFYPLIGLYEPLGQYSNYFYLLLIFRIFYTTIQSFLKTIDKVSILSIAGLVETAAVIAFTFLLIVYYKLGLEGFFITLLISIGLATIVILILTKPFQYFNRKKISLSKIKEMAIFSLPLMPNSMNGWFMNLSNRYFIEYYLGVAATGIFSIAARIPVIFQVVYNTFYNAWIISAFENYDKHDRKYFFTTVHELLFFFFTVGISFTFIILKPVMSVLVAADFYSAWQYMPYLLVGTIFYCMTSFFGVLYIAEKKTKLVLYTTLVGSFLSVTLNIILIPYWGINGSSFSFFISFFVVWMIRVYQTNKFFPLATSYVRILISSALIMIQVWVCYNIELNEWAFQTGILLILLLVNIKTIKMIILHGGNLYDVLIKKRKIKLNRDMISK